MLSCRIESKPAHCIAVSQDMDSVNKQARLADVNLHFLARLLLLQEVGSRAIRYMALFGFNYSTYHHIPIQQTTHRMVYVPLPLSSTRAGLQRRLPLELKEAVMASPPETRTLPCSSAV